jgi:hypothetical protein
MAAVRRHVLQQSQRTFLYSPYLEDHSQAADIIGTWLMRQEVTERIEAAFFAVADPRLQKLLSEAI